MPYTQTMLKCTWGGRIYGNTEIWSNSIHIGAETSSVLPSQGIQNAAVTDLAAVIQDWFTREGSVISEHVTLDWVKLATIGLDGKYVTDASIVDILPAVPGDNPSILAPQLSVVITLGTAVNRGLARTGRFYVPMAGNIGADGKIPTGLTTLMAASALTLINQINDVITQQYPGTRVVVASKERTGAIRNVTEVRVGDVMDTQRSRRNKFVETYQVDGPVIPGPNG